MVGAFWWRNLANQAGPDPRITQQQELRDGGRQRIVNTQVSGGRGGPCELRAVYEREPGIIG